MKIDYAYISELVRRAQDDDGNAFAELYIATYQRQYGMAVRYLQDPEMAEDAIKQLYIHALNRIRSLKDPQMFVSWLDQIAIKLLVYTSNNPDFDMDNYYEISDALDQTQSDLIEIKGNQYSFLQVMSLPSSESQAILLRYYLNMNIREMAGIMSVRTYTVRRNLKSGTLKLEKMLF